MSEQLNFAKPVKEEADFNELTNFRSMLVMNIPLSLWMLDLQVAI